MGSARYHQTQAPEFKAARTKEEFDKSEPTTLKQWVLNKRRPNRRYTFLIAVAALALALTFGLIQSVTGVIQAVVSVRKGE
jgi:Ni/Fe-hydrogenase subunit HybB-like protein